MLIHGGDYVAIFYKDSRILLILIMLSLFSFGLAYIYRKNGENKAEKNLKNSMVHIELLDENNKAQLLKIDRRDIPAEYAAEINDTFSIAEYGQKAGLDGHCYAIKYSDKYVGIILVGKGMESDNDPIEVKGKNFIRIMGFVIDARYRHIGIGTVALKKAIQATEQEYGKSVFLLECHMENKNAINFYEKNGFVNTGCLNGEGTDYYMIMK